MRHDRYINNDSGAYSILPSWVLDKVIEDARENDAKFVRKHAAILQALVGDAEFVARVVVDEPLTQAEQSEWISRVRWPLRVKCGRLLVCGGFDPDTIADLEEDESAFVTVPKGDYTVEVLTYLNTMNGLVLHAEWGPDARLGAWFRRDHAGRAMPSWLASDLFWDPEEDPGHESEWRDFAASYRSGKLAIDASTTSFVGVIVHLLREETPTDLSKPGKDWFFPADAGLRRPERFPLGIPAVGCEDTVSSEVLQAIKSGA